MTDPQYLAPFLSMKNLPAGIPVCASVNPNLVLVEALRRLAARGQMIIRTLELSVTAMPVGDIDAGNVQCPSSRAKLIRSDNTIGGFTNIPFLNVNAKMTSIAATFWLEPVENENDARDPKSTFVQLQYSQTAILDFDDIKWPHITVATLVQQ